MSTLKYIKGNLFDTDCPIIAHGLSTQGVYGAGIAKQIAEMFPEAKKAYINMCKREIPKLGSIQVVSLWSPQTPIRMVANLITQDSYGRNGVYINYDACDKAFDSLLGFCENHQLKLAIPLIGAGLGGGEWAKVEQQLLKELTRHQVEVFVYQKMAS